MGNNYNNSQNEINNLKSELSKANKIINEQKLKIQELQTQLNIYNNNINNLNNNIKNYQNIINQKDIELNNLKNQLLSNNNKIINNFNLDEMMCVNFISGDQQIHYAVPCLKSNTFAEVEEKLYQKFPVYRETNNNFIANGNLVLRFKTIGENKIGNGLPVTLIVPS
jgi:TolA-binding protein